MVKPVLKRKQRKRSILFQWIGSSASARESPDRFSVLSKCRGGISGKWRESVNLAKISALLLLCGLAWCSVPVLAEGFPERGNRADWSDAIPYYNLGNKYLGHGRYAEAATSYEDAVAIYPYDPDFYLNLGVAYRKLDEYQKAEGAFKKALELNGKDWMNWSNLANAYLKQNKYKETKSAFEQALKCTPPAAEKAAIQKDLLDLQKIISMQERQAAASKPVGKAASGKAAAGAQSAKSAAKNAASASTNVATPATPPSRDQLKQGGWDYVY